MSDQGVLTEEERSYYALNARVYARFAPFYDLAAWGLQPLRGEVAITAGARDGVRALDVATGTGAQARAFARRGAEVVGIDISEAMLRIARRNTTLPSVTFRRADATSLPFDDRSFDVSCISFALHEMPPSIRERVLREMARVTKPGGAVLVVDYGLPRNGLARWLVYHLVKLYERAHYADFVRTDVPALLRGAGIELQAQRSARHGLAAIYHGRRLEDAVERPTRESTSRRRCSPSNALSMRAKPSTTIRRLARISR